MKPITLVTGNPNKLKEIQAIAPQRITLASKNFDLPEIQSMDLREVIEHKVRTAFEIVQAPVMVEDVSAGLDTLGGLPGTFYKFFDQQMGNDCLVKLAALAENNRITIRCIAAYFDGDVLLVGLGEIHGQAVEARGEHGFGFDSVVLADGYEKTLGEMSREEKLAISHRGTAFRELFTQLQGKRK